jgi:hypothetical protein
MSLINFLCFRGEKTSSSVRLRKRREEPNRQQQPQQQQNDQAARRKNRHSGDFAFFSPSRHTSPPAASANGESGGGGRLEEDFNYITFPNGVPLVQEVRVGGATAAGHSSPARGGGVTQQQQQQQQHPIRVTMRDINIKEWDSLPKYQVTITKWVRSLTCMSEKLHLLFFNADAESDPLFL